LNKQRHVFSAFAQADSSSTRTFGGTGLGLTISSQLVEMMGGKISLESEEGVGSTFHFTVRLGTVQVAKIEAAPDAAWRHAEEGQPRLRFLVVEDNVVNRLVATRLIEKQNHTVSTAANGREALDVLEREGFDCVLMDVQMPVLGGFEATAAIRERDRNSGGHLPIIAMTAHAMAGDLERCLAAGMDGYIAKPIQAKTLFATVERVLGTLKTHSPNGLAGHPSFRTTQVVMHR
jgi:CheY-like chemotaxis protein